MVIFHSYVKLPEGTTMLSMAHLVDGLLVALRGIVRDSGLHAPALVSPGSLKLTATPRWSSAKSNPKISLKNWW